MEARVGGVYPELAEGNPRMAALRLTRPGGFARFDPPRRTQGKQGNHD